MNPLLSELPFHAHNWLIISLKDFCIVIRKWPTFWPSRMATSIWDLELKEDNKSCVVVISCVSQLLPDRKPCWRFVRILWSSTWSRMCLQTMCSKSLQVIQVRELVCSFQRQTSVAFLENWCNVSQRPVPW